MNPTDKVVPKDQQQNTTAEIEAIAAMTKAARGDAARLGLKFEAYLLDMAVTALSEHLKK
ncbi:MAG: hypothetical protein HKN11_18280 [Rhizobiales bacterium]|nr:hypothetical protein [Hyphomicrobiales bacterium]